MSSDPLATWSMPQVSRYGHVVLGSWWDFRGARNPGWVLLVAASEGAAISCAGRRHRLPAGRGLLLPPERPFDTIPGIGVPLSYVHFGLPDTHLPGLPAEHATILGDDPATRELASALPRCEAAGTGLLTAAALASQAIASAIADLPAARRQRLLFSLANRLPLQPALDHIADHLAGPIYVPALARLCGHGPQWLTRMFRSAFGSTPAQYIISRRIASAMGLLAKPEVSLDTVARNCGFTDRFQLTRTFSKLVGVPPAAWRRRLVNSGAETSHAGTYLPWERPPTA